MTLDAAQSFEKDIIGKKFHTILADPPWRFDNRTIRGSPEYRKHYSTLSLQEIMNIPVQKCITEPCHLYLWVPNAFISEGLEVMKSWGFTYKTNIVWHKIRKDGKPDGSGVGFYFRNVTELILFGVCGKSPRTLEAGRTQVNFMASKKREHSRKPDEVYKLIEQCSRPDYLEIFARNRKEGWHQWGNQLGEKCL